MPLQHDLNDLIVRFAALRRQLDGHPDPLGGLAAVVASGLAGLAERLQTASLSDQGPPPMLLFGGTFQCYPLRNPHVSETAALPVEQLAAEAGLLFSQALSLWHSAQRPSATFEQLAGQLHALSDQTLRAVGDQTTDANRRVTALQQAIAELEQVTGLRRSLEDRLRELQTQQAASLQAVDGLRAQTGQLEKSVADLRGEEKSLQAELDEARQKARGVESLRAELGELKTKVEQGGQERDELLQQAHTLRVKLSDTQALIEEARRQTPTAVAERLEQIWKEIPADEFDKIMSNKS